MLLTPESNFQNLLKKLVPVIVLFAMPFLINAQTLSGTVKDKLNEPLPGASIRVLKGDSTFIKGTITDQNGYFEIKDLSIGRVLIQITYVGFNDLYLKTEITGATLSLGKLVLREKSSAIDEVTVAGQATIATQKGDTTQYNSGAFKTNPDATAEDLINKMPGVTNEDGKLKVQGEEVKQVLVDGKPFFGDDPSAVLKNLPAEVIDKIQVFDRKSDQSQMTGFDDGNTSKTINIITKTQFRNGIFGKTYAGYGYEDKWRGGFSVNFFKDKRRITILANTNNINEQNFTAEDLVGVMSSSSGNSGRPSGRSGNSPREGGSRGGGRSGSGGSSNDANNFLVDQKNGITTTHAFGVNYSNSWKKLDVSGSYFFNYTENNSLSNLNRQFISNETKGITYSETNDAVSKNLNQRLNLRFDWKINAKNNLVFQPKASLQTNKGNSSMFGVSKILETNLSSVSNIYKTLLDGSNFSAPLQYKHSFEKKGRSFSVNLNPGYNSTNGSSDLNYYSFYSDTLPADTISQNAELDKSGYVLNSGVSFVEPLNAKSQLMFNYSSVFTKSDSKKNTFDNQTGQIDSSLSNTFNTTYFSQSLGMSYRYQVDKWNLTAGLAFQKAQLNNEQLFPNYYPLEKPFYSILPNIMFQRKFTPQKNLRINYNSSNNAPSADQLQEVINNRNPLLLTTGNTDLKQDWQNNVNFRYTSIDTKKNTAFFALIGASITRNYIVNSNYIAPYDTLITPSILLSKGSQISKPVNLNGYYNVRSFVNYSFPAIKLKSKINLNGSVSQNRTPALINNEVNYAKSSNAGVGIAITSNISEKLDFTLSSNSTFSHISNSLQTTLNSTYLNQNTRFKIQANPWKGLVFQTDLSHQYYQGLSASFNQNFLLWNAAIAYKFMKSKQADLRLSVYDILKQNNSIARNTSETYYEDVQTTVLQRYFMLTFTYNLRYYKEKKPVEETPKK